MNSSSVNKIEAVKKKSIELFRLVQKQFELSTQVFHLPTPSASVKQKEKMQGNFKNVLAIEEQAYQLEVEIETECCMLLALQKPVANQLRLITSIIKMNSYFKYLNNLIVNVAETSFSINDFHCHSVDVLNCDLKPISNEVHNMFQSGLQAFKNMDLNLAYQIIEQDNVVDDFNSNINTFIEKHLVHYTQQDNLDAFVVLAHLNYLGVAKLLERIADRMVSVAELIIYVLKGSIVRHPSIVKDSVAKKKDALKKDAYKPSH